MIKKMPKTAKQIKNSKDFADIDGSIYTYRSNYKGHKTNKVIQKKQRKIKCGYMYCGIYNSKEGRCVSRRVHRIIAETFIPNPNNYPVVGHRNNIKDDNRIENLYWTTYSENTQKAVNDRLLVNDKGYDDSQSKPVNIYNTHTNELIGSYGSLREAVKETGLSLTTLSRQARYKRPTRRDFYCRFQDDIDVSAPIIVGMFDFDTDKLLETFVNYGQAALKTGFNYKTIGDQCKKGRKPFIKNFDVYFMNINSKCEQTIEKNN